MDDREIIIKACNNAKKNPSLSGLIVRWSNCLLSKQSIRIALVGYLGMSITIYKANWVKRGELLMLSCSDNPDLWDALVDLFGIEGKTIILLHPDDVQQFTKQVLGLDAVTSGHDLSAVMGFD